MDDAVLILADGTIFRGLSFGSPGVAVGEIVFNTAMTGYQEILTDPSYADQLVTLTYPHIGNTGVNPEDEESSRVYAQALVIRSLAPVASNFRATETLPAYMRRHKALGITEIDTRKLTRILRASGAQGAALMTGKYIDEKEGLRLARDFGSMSGRDLAGQTGCARSYRFSESTWRRGVGYTEVTNAPYRVVVYDFGVKRNILRMLASRGCALEVVPPKTSAAEVLASKPDGIFFANGPGDPEACTYAIAALKVFLEKNIPFFGICLGHQLLGLALGGQTKKMKFGHHGANHPVLDLKTGRVVITSQNHGFEVDAKTLPDNVEITHRSLFDGSLQGMAVKGKAVFSVQGHPEASPGPMDWAGAFDLFVRYMAEKKRSVTPGVKR